MSGRLVFDIETNGLHDDLTTIHCIGIYDLDTGEYQGYKPGDVSKAVARLQDADFLVGHNVIGFDIPAIQKIYPLFSPKGIVRDTLVLTRLMWPHIKDRDIPRAKAKKFPGKLIGSHSLEAWGHRLGNYKDDFKGPWDQWSETMHSYMEQDVRVTLTLFQRCEKEAEEWEVPMFNAPPGKDCIELEHRVAEIVSKVERHGFAFDMKRAVDLVGVLTARKQKLEEELQNVFPPEEVTTIFTPKVNNKKLGYQKGVPFEKKTTVVFNPGSRKQIGQRLMAMGWKPKEYGANGDPTVDETTLAGLKYPGAQLLVEYLTIEKRLGQIANGSQSWFRHNKNGRIHGRIQSGGAHTGRMTHSNPNMAQVPGNHAPYGEECRKCFTADKGYVLVGCDADALELRDLAGYMAIYDGGEYINVVLKGDKSQGTDMHTLNSKLVGCDRDTVKVFFYALIYGAGDGKLGEILGNARKGKAARQRLMDGLPALGKLVNAVKNRIAKRGFLIGLDGRRLHARSENAALNTLLQSAGAVQMKRGLVILYDTLFAKGWEFGREYAIVGLIHDEWQANVKPELAQEYGEAAAEAIRAAGRYYSFRCPLDAQFQVGANWSETH